LACPFTRKPIISSYSRCKPFNLFAIGSDRMVVMIGHPVFWIPPSRLYQHLTILQI
jgi:hypothetical protein